MAPSDRTLKAVTIVAVCCSLAAVITAIIGVAVIGRGDQKFNAGRDKALQRCAALHGTWLPDDSHHGYEHHRQGPGYCLKPGSLLFAYPRFEK